jgi:hypothetical protein
VLEACQTTNKACHWSIPEGETLLPRSSWRAKWPCVPVTIGDSVPGALWPQLFRNKGEFSWPTRPPKTIPFLY